MYRTANLALLIFGALLMPMPMVQAASANLQAAGDHGAVARNSNAYAAGAEVRMERPAEQRLVVTEQAGGLREIAMRSPGRELQGGERAPLPGEDGGGRGSWLAMLVAGLGVALISIVRRVRGLS